MDRARRPAGRGRGIGTVTDMDVSTLPATAADEPPARFTRRRLIRWAMILTLGILAVLAIWQDPLYA